MIFVLVFAALALPFIPSGAATRGTSHAHLDALRALAEARRGVGEDAWPRYVEIRDALDASVPKVAPGRDGEPDDSPLDRIWCARFDAPSFAPDRTLLNGARPLVDRVIAATSLPRCAPPPGVQASATAADEAIDAFDPTNHGKVRRIAALLRAEMRIAAEEGRWDRAAECLGALLRFGGQASSDPLLIGLAILVGNRGSALMDVRLLAVHLGPPPQAIDALLAAIDANPPPADAARAALEGERLFMLHALNDVYSDGGLALAWAMDRVDDTSWMLTGSVTERGALPTWRERAFNVRAYFEPRRPAAEIAVGRYCDALRDWAAAPVALRPRNPVIPSEVESFRAIRDWSPVGSVSGLYARLVGRIGEDPAATRATLLVCRRRAERGEWPSTLGEAGANAPDPATGKSFVFDLTPDGPAPFRLARSAGIKLNAEGDFTPARLMWVTKDQAESEK